MDDDPRLDRATEFLSDDPADSPHRPEIDALGDQVVDVLRTVYDPEIPVNIFELGLIYKVDIDDEQARPHRHDPDLAGLPGRGHSAR